MAMSQTGVDEPGLARSQAVVVNVVRNERSARLSGAGEDPSARVLPAEEAVEAARRIGRWPGYAVTPLVRLPGVASRHGLGAIWVKDEATRFGLGSFKAIGGAYAVSELVSALIAEQRGEPVSQDDLLGGRWRDLTSDVTVTTATDGNHGRSVAWGAQLLGCRCVIYLHEHVSAGRQEAIEQFGAETVRIRGSYDDSAREARSAADRNGWVLVSDTATDDYRDVPSMIMQGYRVMLAETLDQLGGVLPTHVFVQGGCGGLAASVCAHLWQALGSQRPVFVTVEPERAACLFASVLTGAITTVGGDLQTLMAGLSVGEVSVVAWDVLATGIDYATTIPDEVVVDTMRLLADLPGGDPAVVAGESGAAGLAAVLAATGNPGVRDRLCLDERSRVLLFNTEGATDPELYSRLVGT